MSEVTHDALKKRITELEKALLDMSKYIWRDDYQKLEPTTRAALDKTRDRSA